MQKVMRAYALGDAKTNLHEQRNKAEILVIQIHPVIQCASICRRERIRSEKLWKNAERCLNRKLLAVLASG